jgi:hypothetical protein
MKTKPSSSAGLCCFC